MGLTIDLLPYAISIKKFRVVHSEKSLLKLINLNQILIVNALFPIDLTPHGIPYGVKSIGKVYIQPKFVFDEQDRVSIFCPRRVTD